MSYIHHHDQSIYWVNKYFKETRWTYQCNVCLYEAYNVSGMRHHITMKHGKYQTLPFSSLMNTEEETSLNRIGKQH